VTELIEIVAYDPKWEVRFVELKVRLLGELGPLASSVEHIGSTAIPGLCAKPIVDIDVVIGRDVDFAAVTKALARIVISSPVFSTAGKYGYDKQVQIEA
jgi:GrpB-like predicted nucleotidyltransferase (UPF0157 family)